MGESGSRQAVRLPLLPLTPGPWALLRVSSVIRAGSICLHFPPTSLPSCLCENESYCLFKRAICLMPLEFICWSIFRFHIQFRPQPPPRGYVTWDGMNPTGIRGPPPPAHPTLAIPVRVGILNIHVASGSCRREGAGERGRLAEKHLAEWSQEGNFFGG